MPGGDRTGPFGMGPMTGRGAGFCAGYGMPGYMNPVPGGGYGMGFGRGRGPGGRGFGGRGWRHRFYATGMPGWMRFGGWPGAYPPVAYQNPDPEMEKEALKTQAEALESELEMIRKRLDQLETNAEAK
jgi:hypothetical protein